MHLHISKSKNAESFYICKSYTKANGSTTSAIVRKLGTLEQLLPEHGPTRDDVLAWAKNEVKIETEKYKKEKEAQTVLIPFHADRQLDYNKQVFYRGGYLFLQSIKAMNFAKIQEQGFIPLYKRERITDDLHDVCGFRTDYQFITKSKMRNIQKKSKGKE